MQTVDKPPEAVVGSPIEFVLWPMPTSTAADGLFTVSVADLVGDDGHVEVRNDEVTGTRAACPGATG